MVKRLFSAVTASAFMAVCSMSSYPVGLIAKADTVTGETADGFTYEIGKDYARITGWNGDTEVIHSLSVPETVEGKDVTEIGQSAFEGLTGIEKIEIPDTVKRINWGAFGKSGIKSIDLPDSIEHLDKKIFDGCENLKELTIPKNLPKNGMTTDLYFGNGYISALMGSYIEKIILEDGMEYVPDDMAWSAPMVKEVVIPESVTTIGSCAFRYCSTLESLDIPDGVTKIEDCAFQGTSLDSIRLPEKLAECEHSLFADCEKLKEVTVPAALTSAKEMFRGSFVETVNIEDGMKKVPDYLLMGTEHITAINIPDTVTSLGTGMLEENTSIKEFTVPKQITEAVRTFRASELESLTFAEGMLSIPDSICQNSSKLERINLPDGLESIGEKAFCECPLLRKADIPMSVKTIGESCFSNDKLLNTVSLPEGIESIEYRAFEKCSALRTITVPSTLSKCGSEVFAYSGLTEAWIADGIGNVPDCLFEKAEELETVHIPSSVKDFGDKTFRGCINLSTLDMPFESGEIMPEENFHSATFEKCYSLFDERVSIYDPENTFVNYSEVVDGDKRIINYTVYYAVNPLFMERFRGGRIEVSVDKTNLIAGRSLPVGLRQHELSESQEYVTFEFTEDDQTGVLRFSTEPQDNAVTDINVVFAADFAGSDRYTKSVSVNNPMSSGTGVSLNVPAYAGIQNGKASAAVYGYYYGSGNVTVYVNDEAAAEVTPSIYTGRYSTTLSFDAKEGDVVNVCAEAGEKKSEVINMPCREQVIEVKKAVLTHNNNHTDYALDITDAFLNGAVPYIAYNPSNPIGFEVTLSDNDCLAVYVSSTVNGKTSSIDLTFDSETGTWKGEGYFDSTIPGTLNINAVRNENKYQLSSDTDGNVMINGRAFDEENGDADTDGGDAIDEFIADTKATVSGDDNNIISVYDTSDVIGKPSGIVNYLGIQSSAVLDGNSVTPQEIADNYEQFGFTESPLTYMDESGKIHRYYVKMLTDDEETTELLNNIEVPEGKEQTPAPVQQKKAAVNSLANRVFNTLADLKGGTDTANKCLNGTIVFECVADSADNKGQARDFVINVTAETEKQTLLTYASKKSFNGHSLSKSVDGYGKCLTAVEHFTNACGMLSDLRDVVNSDDPRVKAHETELECVIVATTMSKATLTVVGGEIIGTSFVAGAGAIAAGVSVLPAVLSVVAVVGAVYAVGVGIDCVSSWLKSIIIGENKVGNDARLNTLIDPSGIAYEFLPSNPVKGASAEIFYKNSDGDEISWNASDYDQINPQITDGAGWFAWDVPEGMWKVRVTAEGYEAAESDWLPVLPVQTGVDLNMKSMLPAEIVSAEYIGNKAEIRFSRHVMDSTLSSETLFLTGKNGEKTECKLTPVKEDGNDTECSIICLVTADGAASLEGLYVNLTADVLSYSGVKSAASVKLLEKSEKEAFENYEADYTLGDVNEDGKIDASDASQILRIYAMLSTVGTTEETGSQMKAADVNTDGKIDASDASYVLGYYAYLSTSTGTPVSIEEFIGR